jgi:hypothetical protein
MKLHEKAKELGIKTTALIKILQEKGHDVSGFNQNLTEEQEADCGIPQETQPLRMEAQFDDAKAFTTVLVVPVVAGDTRPNSLHEVVFVRMFAVEDSFEILDILDRKTFPNKPQANLKAQENLARINNGIKPRFD